MTSTMDLVRSTPPAADGPDPRRFRALAIIAVAQLMIVLDASVVTIALPSAQHALGISVANRQWVMTAYTLAFGGLLLLGGRIADYFGRKRMFVISLLGFAGASALGGLAQNAAMLFSARALQGSFAAVMAPSALSLITVTFTEPKERARAFGVYGAIAGGGAAIGLILGGILTQYASWRWTLLINVPIAVLAAVFATREVRESRSEARKGYDVAGAITATTGLLSLVYGFTRAGTDGWGSSVTIALMALAAVLLTSFVLIERNSRHPLLPLRVVLDRNRGGSFIAALLVGIAMFATFLFLTYYFQGTLGYSAVRTGFAFLPFSLGIITGATLSSRILPRLGPKVVMVTGFLLAACGLFLFSHVGVHTDYLTRLLPAEVIVSFGMGTAFVPLSSTALIGVDPSDAGVASAMVNTTQQTGASLGVSLLNTVAATATANFLLKHGISPIARAEAYVHGYTVSFTISAVLLATAAVSTLLILRATRSDVAPAEFGIEPEATELGFDDEPAELGFEPEPVPVWASLRDPA
ncbi:MAG: MFS transporter [Acidimicrobiales bacterium]